MNGNDKKDAQQENESAPKLGLALSGGGFRASFFHIGVLAQMAELGLLRHVEVISTVSGGSIIGALYYLHVKKLLDNSNNKTIENKTYVKIVQKIEEDRDFGIAVNVISWWIEIFIIREYFEFTHLDHGLAMFIKHAAIKIFII